MSKRHPRGPTRRALAAALGGALTTALLAGCGSDPESFNNADTEYATNLIVHHAQTLQLLDLTLGRDALDTRIGAMADRTRTGRYGEVATCKKLLKSWKRAIPKTALEHNHSNQDIDHDTSIPGVLSNDRVRALEAKKGETFQKVWLRELIAHEEGAVEIAKQAIEHGTDEKVIKFAKKDQATHETQVDRLEQLLGS